MDNPCACNMPCNRVHYEHRLSYAVLSKFNMKKVALGHSERKEYVNQKFLKARDQSQCTDKETNKTNTKQLKAFSGIIMNTNYTLSNTIRKFGNGAMYVKILEIPDRKMDC